MKQNKKAIKRSWWLTALRWLGWALLLPFLVAGWINEQVYRRR